MKKIDPKKQKGLSALKKKNPKLVATMGYMKKGGRAGYKAGRRVGGGKSMGNLPTPIRLSLVNKKKEELKKG